MAKDFSSELAKAISAMPAQKPIRGVGRPRKQVAPPVEPKQEMQEPDATPFDEWDDDVLSTEEQFRLAKVDLPYSIHVAGEFRLKPGATPTSIARMLEAALDGRANTTDNLLKLHRHMVSSFANGGVALASGALFTELTRILREQGTPPPNEKGRSILEEMRLEGRFE